MLCPTSHAQLNVDAGGNIRSVLFPRTATGAGEKRVLYRAVRSCCCLLSRSVSASHIAHAYLSPNSRRRARRSTTTSRSRDFNPTRYNTQAANAACRHTIDTPQSLDLPLQAPICGRNLLGVGPKPAGNLLSRVAHQLSCPDLPCLS